MLNQGKPEQQYFPALTGIRFLAGVMNFLHHFNIFQVKHFGIAIRKFVYEFHIGLTIFFVLSGFLISYRYAERIPKSLSQLREYFINRFARVFPIYFILTTIVFIPFVCNSSFFENIVAYILNITFVKGFFLDFKNTGIGPGWSLTVEETFYFLFPLIIISAKYVKLIFQPLIFFATGILLWLVFRHVSFYGFFKNLDLIAGYTFFGRCFEFYCGILLANYIKAKKETFSIQRKIPLLTTASCFYMVSCIIWLAVNRTIHSGGTHIFFENLINNIILPPAIALLFYGLFSENSLLKRFLSNKFIQLLGKSSYVLYLIQATFLFPILYYGTGMNTWLVFIIMQTIAVFMLIYIEEPLNKKVRQALLKKKLPKLKSSQ